MYRHSLHKAGGEIRSWHGSELDDAAQGPASGSAHVSWRSCMMTQNTGSRPGKTRRLDSSDSESVGPLACPCACNRALVVTGTVPGDAGVTVFLQRLTGTRACSNLNSASPTRARCNSQTPAADSAVARRRLDGIKTQDGPDLKKLKFHAHAHVLAPRARSSKQTLRLVSYNLIGASCMKPLTVRTLYCIESFPIF